MGLLKNIKKIMQTDSVKCEHLKDIDENVKPKTQVCEECGKSGSLRMCLTCGHVGCCDSSIGRHATKHFQKTGHAVMAVFPNKEWKWCYIDKDYLY